MSCNMIDNKSSKYFANISKHKLFTLFQNEKRYGSEISINVFGKNIHV